MSRPVAVVTGTSSGIGAAIASALLAHDWTVCGMSRRQATFESPNYTHCEIDLRDPESYAQQVSIILQRYGQINALVNNAGVGYFAPHEELSVQQLDELVQVNLLAPLLLTKLFLRSLKTTQGSIISVASFSALESSSHGAAYAATKAGLKHFNDSLFDEVRKSGVKVTTISPDITRTPFFDHLSFVPEAHPEAAIEPTEIAETVVQILTQRHGAVTTHVVIRPQRLLLTKRAIPRD